MSDQAAKREPIRLSISILEEDDARLLRVKHVLEKREGRRVTISEILRDALKGYEAKIVIEA